MKSEMSFQFSSETKEKEDDENGHESCFLASIGKFYFRDQNAT